MSEPAPRGRRLSPAARRQHILDVARRLFSESPLSDVSTRDIAESAGVARSLVHHYFGGINEVFMAVVAQGGAALAEVRNAGTETPFEERICHNIAASLDVIGSNRETWLAVMGHTSGSTDPRIAALVAILRERFVQHTLENNGDLLTDNRQTRFALRCFNAFSVEATRAWLAGDETREATEALLVATFRELALRVVPALPAT